MIIDFISGYGLAFLIGVQIGFLNCIYKENKKVSQKLGNIERELIGINYDTAKIFKFMVEINKKTYERLIEIEKEKLRTIITHEK